MMNKTINRTTSGVPNYFISHELTETSKMCDYDYDDEHPERRFYMSLLHKLSFYDPIVNSLIVEVEFMTETSDTIIAALDIIQNTNIEYFTEPIVIRDKSIKVNGQMRQDAAIAISYLMTGEIKIDILCNSTITDISIHKRFLDEFIYVMNVEEDFSMYMMYSGNDGW